MGTNIVRVDTKHGAPSLVHGDKRSNSMTIEVPDADLEQLKTDAEAHQATVTVLRRKD